MAYDGALAARIRAVLNGAADVEERKMFGGVAFLIGGRMACGVVADELMVRVPKETYKTTLRRRHARPMDFTGRPLKGFVYVGRPGIRSASQLRRWIALGQQGASQAAAKAGMRR